MECVPCLSRLKSAFDSFPRDKIWEALSVPVDLAEAVNSIYRGIVRLNGQEFKHFTIVRRVIQSDS